MSDRSDQGDPHETRLAAAIDAYRALEPQRVRDPFAAPRLRAVLAPPRRRAWSWASPAPAFAGAFLTLAIALLPTTPMLSPEAAADRVAAGPMIAESSPLLSATTATAPGIEPHRVVLAAVSLALGGLGLRGLLRRS
jgi:hypothetical protein